ncbi:MAG: hypothetical protein ACOCXG_02010 [Nanoarchaeota archaeon]
MDEYIERMARTFKILSNPNNLRLLLLLQNGEKNLIEIYSEFESKGLSLTEISNSIKLLSKVDFVNYQLFGNSKFYSLNSDNSCIKLLKKPLTNVACGKPPCYNLSEL